ncbi:hypothetical protein HY407_00200, partial [Candidatus Gottesmanbacteria bacterium]|nr:hypothetical protein [Candidatus Gottesmanbacteria bacterium]
IINYKLQIRNFSLFLSFLLLLLFLPSRVQAVSTIDFSSTKDFFKEIKVGDSISGDISSSNIPNPYKAGGFLVGYRLEIPTSVDAGEVELKVQSCAFKLLFVCMGDAFDETIYVYNKDFVPVGGKEEEFRYKDSVDLADIEIKDRILYFLVGSEDASETGQFILSANLQISE